ncbi:MAG: glycine cleavage system aminomethyltransferase GcvT [Candidatus Thorarchaeota archaeon]|nr:glycine cleavage system aminomethyltransferase GcvT [Candidatus Thorarchaeota archaeon]
MTDKLLRTQLYDWHKTHGDVVPFAGWEMPVRFSDIREEHMAVRDSVGIFDTSHMYRFFIEGSQAVDFLQRLTTNNVRKLEINGGQYTTCLNENAGMHDDLTLYRIEENKFIWITNASNGPKIWKHLMEHAPQYDVSIQDKSREIAMVAVQGPQSMTLLSRMAGMDVSTYNRFTCHPAKLAKYDCYLCRTGYTGEDGGEVLVLNTPDTEEGRERAIAFWEELLSQGDDLGIKPCGLGARDSTRLEAGFVLYGNELNEDTTPLEARIPYAVKFKVDPKYIGYNLLKQQKEAGVRKTRIGLVMVDRGIPRKGYAIQLNNERIGTVTSGTLSPLLQKGIALAYVKPDVVDTGQVVEIDIKGRVRRAEVTNWPFYDPDKYGSTRVSDST